VFFDNCTSPVLPAALHAFLETQASSAYHVRFMSEYGFREDTPDEVWIRRLGEDVPADWIVITGDRRITKNKAERAAWIRAGLRGFVLAPAYQRMPVHQQASLLLWRWPGMETFISAAARGSLFELPIRRSGGFRPLPV
jgi:PIN domain-containing protein